MKILYLASARLPTEKAHGYQIVKMCEAFATTGSAVTLYIPSRRNPLQESIETYYGIDPCFETRVLPCFDFFALPFLPQKLAFYLNLIAFALIAYFKVKPAQDDVVFTRSPEIAWFFSRKGIKTVFECHEVPLRRRMVFAFLVRHVWKMVATSKGVQNILLKMLSQNPPQISVLPNGFDPKVFDTPESKITARQKLGIDPQLFYAVYTGHLYDWKGVGTLFAASAQLSPDFRVYVVGGSAADYEKCRQKNPQARVMHVAFSQRSQVALWLKAADVLILPNTARSEFSKEQTSPIKLFEYMASQRPVIASDLPSLREILNDTNACFFTSDDSADLARKMMSLRDAPQLAEKLAQQAYRDGQAYTWDNRAQAVFKFLGVSPQKSN